MYSIEKTSYGFKLTFAGFIEADEMQKWQNEMESALPKNGLKFGILIDLRTLKPLPPDAQAIMVQGQASCKKAGMERSCVILENSTTTMQFKRLGKDSGIYEFERYIDAASTPAWESVAVKWISHAEDPDA